MAVTGAGTASYPYILTEPADLNFIRTKLSSHFRLGNDIDMSSYGEFAPIGSNGTAVRFTGVLDGNGFKIKNLKIRKPDPENRGYTGLFGSLFGTVKNLAVTDADINYQGRYSGIIAGVLVNPGTIDNCYTSGYVSGLTAGGICGITGAITSNCFSFADIEGKENSYGIGRIDSAVAAKIENCHFYGTSPTSVTGEKGVSSTYRSDRVINVYYDSTLNPDFVSVGNSRSTAQMKSGTPFSGWNVSIWTFDEGKYPYLTSLGEPVIAVPAQKETITVVSYTEPFESYLRKSRRKVVTSASFSLPITQSVHRKLLTGCVNIVDEIVSSVVVLKNANIKTHTLRSTLQEISGYSQSASKAVRGIGSYIDPVASYVEIQLPEKVYEPVYAIAHFVVNPTMVQMEFNKTELETLNNKTTADNLTGESVISHEENRTNTEVI